MIVIGSGGFIGSHLVRSFQPKVYTHYKEAPFILDLKDPCLETLPLEGVSHAIIAAGCANINTCEKEPEKTQAINVTGTLKLAENCMEREIIPILFSTDYVFEGLDEDYREDSPLSPINAYGQQKGELEARIDSVTGGKHLMLRLSKIYSTMQGDRTLLDEMMCHLVQSRPIRAATDQIFCPMHIDDLITSIDILIKQKQTGLYNCCGKEKISRYNLALKVVRALGLSEDLVKPISLDDLGGSPRPKNTACSSEKLFETIPFSPRRLSESIAALAYCYVGEAVPS